MEGREGRRERASRRAFEEMRLASLSLSGVHRMAHVETLDRATH